MYTYLMIGVVVQIIILIERLVIRQVVTADDFYNCWRFWLGVTIGLIVCFTLNILLWPITIIVEVYDIVINK